MGSLKFSPLEVEALNGAEPKRTIWKYALEVTDLQIIRLPFGARPLGVQLQFGEPMLWAMVDPSAPLEARSIVTLGTGNPFSGIAGEYLGTYQLTGGALVFHVFEGSL